MGIDRKDIGENDTFSLELGVSRRKLMKQLGAIGAVSSVAGCTALLEDRDSAEDGSDGSGGGGGQNSGTQDFEYSRIPMISPPTAPVDNASPKTGEKRRAEFVLQNVANPFFTPLIAGFNDALNQFGWSGGVTGPTNPSSAVPQQIEMINTLIDQLQGGRDVLVTTILDEQAYIDPIQRALDANIAVINGHTTPSRDVWNNEVMRENFTYKGRPIVIPHVGILDRQGGIAMAAEAYERMQSELAADEYTVLIGNGLPGNPAVTRRVDPGARSYLKTKEDVHLIEETLDVTTDYGKAQSRIVSKLNANSDINVVMGAGFWTAVGASQAVESDQITRDLIICGFDLVDVVLDGIKNGHIDFTMGQDPYSQGFLNVPLAWMWMERGIEMKHLEYGVTFVDKTNVDYALNRNRWGALRKWQKQNF
jgi:simple sugar transport system substrate-binding protein